MKQSLTWTGFFVLLSVFLLVLGLSIFKEHKSETSQPTEAQLACPFSSEEVGFAYGAQSDTRWTFNYHSVLMVGLELNDTDHNRFPYIQNPIRTIDANKDCSALIIEHLELWNSSEITTPVTTTDKVKEDTFLVKNKEVYFLTDYLNPIISGTLSGQASGDIPTERVYGGGGLFYQYLNSVEEWKHIKLDISANISLVSKNPTVFLEEKEFEAKRSQYGKLARCSEIYSDKLWLDGDHPYLLYCMFDVDGISFLTTIGSITHQKTGCLSKLTKNVYVQEGANENGDPIYPAIKYAVTFDIPSDCTRHNLDEIDITVNN